MSDDPQAATVGPMETWLAGLGLTDVFTGEWSIDHANTLYAKAREMDTALAAAQSEIARLTAALQEKRPLSIDCDGCGQVVTIPQSGSVGCGCTNTRWSLAPSRWPPSTSKAGGVRLVAEQARAALTTTEEAG